MISATATLTTPTDILRLTNVQAQMDSGAFCNFIISEEETLFRKYFGYTFYGDLIGDLATYPSVPFATSTVYNVGDYVEFNGVVWQVIQATTGTQIPPNKAYFTVPAKFTTAAYQYLWDRYLGRIIANVVAGRVVFTQSIRLTEKGLGRASGENFEPATRGDVADYRIETDARTQQDIRTMEAYIMENTASFPNYKLVLEQAANACKEKRTKYRPNNFGFKIPTGDGGTCSHCGDYYGSCGCHC